VPSSRCSRSRRSAWPPAAVLVAQPAAAQDGGSLILDDGFRQSSTDPRFLALGQACLTSATAPGTDGRLGACTAVSPPAPGLTADGEGYLKLTDAEQDRTGAALYNHPIPSSGGLDITFTQYQYGGTGVGARPDLRADGIGFFLTDGERQLTQPGGWGGSLGYAQTGTGEGVRGGYLGVGLDSFGNYVNDAFGKGQGCTPPTGSPSPVTATAYDDLVPDTVGIRGPGDGMTGYCFLTATIRRTNDTGQPPAPPQGQASAAGRYWTTTLPGQLSAANLADATRYVHITVSPATADEHPLVTVSVDFDGPGSAGFVQVLSYRMPTPPPPTYNFGFAASTGDHTNVHLIRDLRVESVEPLDQLNLVKQVDRTHDQPESYGEGDQVPYEFVLTNTGQSTLTDLRVDDPLVSDVRCPVTSLAPAGQAGSSTVCTGTRTVTAEEAATRTELTNTAIAHGTAAGGDVTSNESSVTVPVTLRPAIAVEKRVETITRAGEEVDVDGPVRVGDRITYGFLVHNAGNVELTGVHVTDPRLAGLSCASSTLAIGATTTCAAEPYTVTDADLERGEVVNTATAHGTATIPGSEPRELEASDGTTTPTVAAAPGITLTKTPRLVPAGGADRADAEVGDAVAYTFTVQNTGTVTLTGVTVTDPSLGGQVECAATPAFASTLAPGESTTCEATARHTVTQADVDRGSVDNTATASGHPPTGPAAVDEDDASVPTVAADPRIEVFKTATLPEDATEAQVGDVVTYGFVVSNVGNVTLTGVRVTDPRLGAVTCEDSRLVPGASTTCSAPPYTVTADDAGGLANTATASGTPPSGDDVTDEDTATVPVFVAAPSVVLEKRADRAPGDPLPAAGDTIRYVYTVTNNGNVRITGLTVTDDHVPAGAECVATALDPGDQTTCTAAYVVTDADAVAGTVTNVATATATGPDGPVTDDSTETVQVQQPVAGIAVVKSADLGTLPPAIGDTVTFELRVTNTGTVALSPVTVTDPLADSVDCPATSLAVGASMTCRATLTVTQAQVLVGEVHNTAHAEGTPPASSGLDPVDDTDDETVPTVEPVTGLVVDKRADVPGPDPDVVALGDRIVYRYVVTNTGTLPVTRVVVHDDRLGVVDCPAGTLAPSASTTCTASYVVTQADVDAGHVANVARATGTGPGGDEVRSDEDHQDVPTVPANPTLTVRKTATLHDEDGDGLADVGEAVSYRYVVTATGNVSVHAVRVADDRVRVRCPARTLAPGESLVCTARGVVTQADLDGGAAVNVATAHGTGPQSERVRSPEDRAAVPADARWELAVHKRADLLDTDGDGLATTGEVIVFRTTATNTGTTTLTDVVVTDVDDRATCTRATLAPGQTLTCTVRHTTTRADVRAGAVTDRATGLGNNPSGYVVGGEASATVGTVPVPPPLAETGADAVHPAGGAVALVVLGSLLAWAGARTRVSSPRGGPVQ